MRVSKTLSLLFVVCAFVAAPAFSKVCHPKKMVTCNATELVQTAPAKAAPVVKAVKPAKTSTAPAAKPQQQARVCGPWIHFGCVAQPLG